MTRFAVREATAGDAAGIAHAHVDSWRASYRGILPDAVLDRMDVAQRTAARQRIADDHARDPAQLSLVAYDVTHGDVVGFCDAGPARRQRLVGAATAEIYALYLVHRAKRYGLGSEMFERVGEWLRARSPAPSLVIWVLENNAHARRFYEARGGRLGPTVQSNVSGFAVTERAYLWDRI